MLLSFLHPKCGVKSKPFHYLLPQLIPGPPEEQNQSIQTLLLNPSYLSLPLPPCCSNAGAAQKLENQHLYLASNLRKLAAVSNGDGILGSAVLATLGLC